MSGRPLYKKLPQQQRQRFLRWLTPGIHVKRWLTLFLLASVLAALSLLFCFLSLPIAPSVARLASSFRVWLGGSGSISWWLGLVLLVAALVLGWYSILQMNRAILRGIGAVPEEVARELQQRFQLSQGPTIVAIGGGTGLSTLLSGLKTKTSNITALVTVADDGGSSGRLRESLGMVAPGDLTDCYAALSKYPALAQLLLHRFERGEGLEGHTFGNLLLATLSEQRGGLTHAIHDLHEILRVQGQIYPATTQPVTLVAHLDDGRAIRGESRLARELGCATVRAVELEPAQPPALAEAVQAINEAELLVLGPGSLFTSILPVLLVPELGAAIRKSRAKLVYVAALMTEPGETDGLSLGDHDRLITEHLGRQPDVLLVNSTALPPRLVHRYQQDASFPLLPQLPNNLAVDRLVSKPLLATHDQDQIRHDSAKVTEALLALAPPTPRRWMEEELSD